MIPSENGLAVVTVLLNVTGRDVGGFVREASARLAAQLTLPAGSFVEWSGQYQSQEHARARLLLVVPAALVVIFVLLYFTYGSWIEAALVLLAVPFALTGGVCLLWLSGYNFSVAVWVGFIALFGTAVQTGMLMVLYLQDAVDRAEQRTGAPLTPRGLRDAVVEGALLRLRPKVMTTATVVVALLPIFWTSRVGAEVLKPLATPVLGGMLSSLLHVLVITPVIFFALHRRRVGRIAGAVQEEPERRLRFDGRGRRAWIVAGALAALLVIIVLVGRYVRNESQPRAPVAMAPGSTVLRTVESAGLSIVLGAAAERPHLGQSRFVLEFRDVRSGALVDVGTVTANGTMTMPGMTMSGGVQVQRLDMPGQYVCSGEFGMAGAWAFTLDWNGPRGAGHTTFELEVH
jgi:Cu(I)/Ag(I) efflux system membrane protein CusA/SilA